MLFGRQKSFCAQAVLDDVWRQKIALCGLQPGIFEKEYNLGPVLRNSLSSPTLPSSKTSYMFALWPSSSCACLTGREDTAGTRLPESLDPEHPLTAPNAWVGLVTLVSPS